MEFLRILSLTGPNFWSRRSVLEAWVDLGDLAEARSDTVPGLFERLSSWLPGLIEHRCGLGVRGGFFERLREGTYPAHVLEHVAIELQNLAGTPVGFGKARETSQPGVYKVAVRFREEAVGRESLHVARELILAAMRGESYDVAAPIARLRTLVEQVSLGPSTLAIVAAAEARGIPVRRLNDGSLVQLGHGARQRRIWTAETDRTSAIGESIAQDKELTKSLLRAVGVPVPEGRVAADAPDAWAAACAIGVPVVGKPVAGNHGRGVFIGLRTQVEVETAYATAAQEGSGVIVERAIAGNEHRLLIVGGHVVAAARGEDAWVVGDGVHAVRELVDKQLNSDPRRGDSDEFPLHPISFDAATLLELEREGYHPGSIPDATSRVLIQRNGNVAFDVTDRVHPTIAAQMSLAARTVGLDIAGIDLVTEDIARPLEEVRGALIEVNASPGLHMHLKPAGGSARPVGEAIVDTLFATGNDGRIPLVCVTGTSGKTTVSHLVSRLLATQGLRVGLACSDGTYLGGRLLVAGDSTGAEGARHLLVNPAVEAAVIEAGARGILREGLGFDKCQVAIVTNIREADHLGESYIETPEHMFTVKRCPVDVVLPSGTAVLNGSDPLVANMAPLCAGAVIFFALDVRHPVLAQHRKEGGRVVGVDNGQIVLCHGDDETRLDDLAVVPMTYGGRVGFQIENVLAAVAAGWALGLVADELRRALTAFGGDVEDGGGRFHVLERHGATLIVDACRNVCALDALMPALDAWPSTHRAIVFAVGPGQRDADVVLQAQRLARAFDRVVLYPDSGARERPTRALFDLIRRGITGGRTVEVLETASHGKAIERALHQARPGDLLLLQTESVGSASTLAMVRTWMTASDTATASRGVMP
ncbi:MAG: cyanophycin synthetase [Myxococcota bacterium]